jgi:addiction module HigA family antidote
MSNLLNGSAGMSAEMALRFEKAFGFNADTLMRMQTAHDMASLRSRERHIKVQRIVPAPA